MLTKKEVGTDGNRVICKVKSKNPNFLFGR
jgi:hypothetical protein